MVHVGRPGDRVVAPVAARRAVALGPLIVILATSTAAAPRAVASTTILLPITCKNVVTAIYYSIDFRELIRLFELNDKARSGKNNQTI